jgi:hypothetical protein
LSNSEIIVKDFHKDKTSYLIWVQDKNTLVNKIMRRISEKNHKINHKRSKKNHKKSKQIINIKITYQRFDYLDKARLIHIWKIVEDIIINKEFSKNYNIYI